MNTNYYNNITLFSVYVAPQVLWYWIWWHLLLLYSVRFWSPFQSHYLILFCETFGHVERSFVLVKRGIMTPWPLRHHGRNVDQSDTECTARIRMHEISGYLTLPSFVFCWFYPPIPGISEYKNYSWNCSTLEGWRDVLSRNVDKQIPSYAAQQPTRTKTSNLNSFAPLHVIFSANFFSMLYLYEYPCISFYFVRYSFVLFY